MSRLFRIRDELLARLPAPPSERIELEEAEGRWLAEPVLAAVPSPPLTCSAMDGFAIRTGDLASIPGRPCTLPVAFTLYAGDLATDPLPPGMAARIFTGAPLPPGADAVVREEATAREAERVVLRQEPRPGEHVRLAGEDVPAGGLALPAGTRLGPRQLALCAAVGCSEVAVARRPRVAILTTGDEIRPASHSGFQRPRAPGPDLRARGRGGVARQGAR